MIFAATFLSSTFLVATSCKTTSSDAEQKESLENTEAAEDPEASKSEPEVELSGPHPHPKVASAWETRSIIMTHPQPEGERLTTCVDSLTALTTEAENQQDMVDATRQVQLVAGNDPELYHWCFYQIMAALDTRMEQGGSLLDELAPAFFTSMRKLWVLGRALDAHHGGNSYFTYLRRRYRQISRDFFGRSVDITGIPMGNMPKAKSSPPGVKPAGEAPVQEGDDNFSDE